MKRISSESVVSSAAALVALGLALTIICSRPVHAGEQPQEPEGAQAGLHVTDPFRRGVDGEEVSSEDPLAALRPAARALPPTRVACQLALHIRVLEIGEANSVDAKAELGDLLEGNRGHIAREKRPAHTCQVRILDERELRKMLGRLRELGVVKVLAEPTLVALDGRETTVHSGGEVPILEVDQTVNGERRTQIRFHPVGHTIRVVPKVSGQGTFYLGFSYEVNKMSPQSNEKLEVRIPKLESRKTEASVKLRAGQTALLVNRHTMEERDAEDDPPVLIVVVTPELVDPAEAPPVSGWGFQPRAYSQAISRDDDHKNSLRMAGDSTRGVQLNRVLADEISHLEMQKSLLLASYSANHPKVKSLQSQLDSLRRRQADKLLAAMEREIHTETTNPDTLAKPRPAKRRVRSNQEPSPRSPNSGEQRVQRIESGPILDELRALREDVRTVRRDVNRLIELLEKRQGSEDRSKHVELPEQKPKPASHDLPAESWDMTLKEAITIALQNSEALIVTSVDNRTTIHRATADMSMSDVKDKAASLVKDVEHAYWGLWRACRNLETTKEARDASLESWRGVSSEKEASDVEVECDARKQYFLFRGKVVDALRAVYAGEHRLRFLLGLSSEDGRLIRPCEDPSLTKASFDWDESRTEALDNRTELARQRWKLQQRELELAAAKAAAIPAISTSNAYQWTERQQLLPVGKRAAMQGVRNAQLLLAREQAAMEDIELGVVHELAGAVRNLDAACSLAQTHSNSRRATEQEVEALKGRHSHSAAPDALADALGRRAATAIDYWKSLADFANALSDVHLKKGSLLSYRNIVVDDSAVTEREKDNRDASD